MNCTATSLEKSMALGAKKSNSERTEDLKALEAEEPEPTSTTGQLLMAEFDEQNDYVDADSDGAPPTCDNSSQWPGSSTESESFDGSYHGLLDYSSDVGQLYEQSQTLLFTIPSEIRLKIYEEVIGKDNFTHVEASPQSSRLVDFDDENSVCEPRGPFVILEKCHYDGKMETELYHRMANAKDYVAVTDDNVNSDTKLDDPAHQGFQSLDHETFFSVRHPNCLLSERPKYGGFDLRFLRTCKRIQLANVRSLHFDISSVCDMEGWPYSLEENKVNMFPSLQSLSIWLDLPLDLSSKDRTKDYMKSMIFDVYYKKPFCLFRKCPLRKAKITLNPGFFPGQKLPEGHISWADMGSWCREFEDRLLLPWKGPIDLLDN
ncbi:hypothetical protein TWF594_002657 [Orbilia oligospora]|uniref:Uncharacterized protein n=1 Tax=Orbilia oligospora TaxID=2813651 RepID=A0A7C8K5C4_ORBOL|nr:hypothetical protein TWF706_006153 [Orbilia oligospora]KAF3146765.1 hypothetical protein TWF703_004037 [Orbilia oligospora]KAF3147437.1 hypothetical protein TWF594_002657 [Orbilia oligospora]